MQVHSGKKISVTSKPMAKKPALEIELPEEGDSTPPLPVLSTSTPKEHPKPNKGLNLSTKSGTQKGSSGTTLDPSDSKRKNDSGTVLKKNSNKDIPSPQASLQPRASLGSPKSSLHEQGREKILMSYGSEKNLGSGKAGERKEISVRGPKLEELQQELQIHQQTIAALRTRQAQLGRELQVLRGQNSVLRQENKALLEEVAEAKKKVQKFRLSNEETKKILHDRIRNFNQEGNELQTLRNLNQNLNTRNQELELQITHLLAHPNHNLPHHHHDSPQDLRTETLSEGPSLISDRLNMITSAVKEVVPLSGSRISGLYLRESEGDFRVFEGMDFLEQDLELQSYITGKEESYLEDSKANMQVFDSIRQQYEQILAEMELKYKNLAEDYEQTIAAQAGEIYDLELQNEELALKNQAQHEDNQHSITDDAAILRAQQEIAVLNLTIFELRAANRTLLEQNEHQKAQRRFLQAEVAQNELRRKFRDENDKFQFNVGKLNLLNIIDKLKLQVDREKNKYRRLCKRISEPE